MAIIQDASDLISLLTAGAIADMDGYVSRRTGGASGAPETFHLQKRPRINGSAANATVTAQWESMWRYDGAPMSHGATPTTWADPDETTAGGLQQTDETTAQKRLAELVVHGNFIGTVVLYDRLGHMGGLGVGSGTQNFNGGSDAAITRYTDGAGNQIWLEVYTSITGGTLREATIAYKNSAGASKTTPSFAVGGSGLSELARIIKVPLAAGDDGVTAVVSINFATGLGGSGNYGVSIVHPLLMFPLGPTGVGDVMGFLNGPFPVVKPNACLAMAVLARTNVGARLDLLSTFIENS